jgi:hypothetical protein
MFANVLGQPVAMSSNAERFGEIVKARRIELEMSQLAVHAAGGPSNTKLTEIENGLLENLTMSTAKKLDRGLSWQTGSARDVWNGGDAVPLVARGLRSSESESIREQIGDLIEDPALRRRVLDLLTETDGG